MVMAGVIGANGQAQSIGVGQGWTIRRTMIAIGMGFLSVFSGAARATSTQLELKRPEELERCFEPSHETAFSGIGPLTMESLGGICLAEDSPRDLKLRIRSKLRENDGSEKISSKEGKALWRYVKKVECEEELGRILDMLETFQLPEQFLSDLIDNPQIHDEWVIDPFLVASGMKPAAMLGMFSREGREILSADVTLSHHLLNILLLNKDPNVSEEDYRFLPVEWYKGKKLLFVHIERFAAVLAKYGLIQYHEAVKAPTKMVAAIERAKESADQNEVRRVIMAMGESMQIDRNHAELGAAVIVSNNEQGGLYDLALHHADSKIGPQLSFITYEQVLKGEDLKSGRELAPRLLARFGPRFAIRALATIDDIRGGHSSFTVELERDGSRFEGVERVAFADVNEDTDAAQSLVNVFNYEMALLGLDWKTTKKKTTVEKPSVMWRDFLAKKIAEKQKSMAARL